MRSVEKTVYRFDELDEDAKRKCKEDHASVWGYSWGDDAFESLKALAAHFGGKLTNWEIDYFSCSHSSCEFRMPEMTKKEIAAKLKELGSYNRRTLRGNGDCKLTGVCFGEDAIDGFRIAFRREGITDLGELMDCAFDSWLKSVQADCEYQYSDEAFSETCEANSWEFNEDGSFYRGARA
jgi:hypothetical protein